MSLLGSLGIYSSFTALSRFALSDPHALGYGYGWEPLQIAWFAVPQTIGCVASFFVVRNLVGRNRPIQALALGFVIVALAFTFYAVLTVDPALALMGLLLNSLGISIILALTQIVLVRSVPASQSGIVLGLSIMLYTLGNAIGAAIAAVCFQSFGSTPEAPSLEAFKVLFIFGGVAALVGLLLCVPLARSRRADPVPAPVAETSPG
jgi:predicted MFS family arabinose efflux permease